jgi:pyruvate/2-oxoglutarate dehydrogenase complex dihydrolipoamide dehydrogenase (E3) component
MQKKFDVVILGAGTAGLAALKEVRRHTKSVLMIDPGPLGTTCARVGCMPSKVFIQIAHDVHPARLLETRGILPENGRAQLSRVMDEVRRYRDHFDAPIVRDIQALGEHFLQGHARFTGPRSLSVDGKHQLEAQSIVIVAGDVDQNKQLLHEASDEGRIAGYNACHETPIPLARRTPLAVVFTHPGLAMVGRREAASGRTVIGKASYDDQGRAKIMGENEGAAHLYVAAADERLVGADILAPGAEHLAHLLAWAVSQRLTVHEMLELPFYHPTLEEGIRTALRNAADQL